MGGPWCCAATRTSQSFTGGLLKVRPGIADEAPEDVLLELRLGVRASGAAELIQAGEERPGGVGRPAIDAAAPPPAGGRIRLGGRGLGDQVAQRSHDDFANRHEWI